MNELNRPQLFTGKEEVDEIRERWNFAEAVINNDKSGDRKYQIVFEIDAGTIDQAICEGWEMAWNCEIEPRYVVTEKKDFDHIRKHWHFGVPYVNNDGVENKKYLITFEVDSATIELVICLIWDIIKICEREPEYIILDNGLKIPWAATLAHYFAAKGRISFLEYLTGSLKFDKELFQRHE